jgi:hypothetical protein
MGDGGQSEAVQELVTQATSALLQWLDEGWIETDAEWNVDRARIAVNRDWYAPYWIVTFIIDDAPWWGDSISVEVEELPHQGFQIHIDSDRFALENISCWHREEGFPEGHWRVSSPCPSTVSRVLEVCSERPSVNKQNLGSSAQAEARIPLNFAGQRPRDLGWANSSHWMEEDL